MTVLRCTLVAPYRRPQPPFTGTNTPRLSFEKSCCCSGVSLTIPQPLFGMAEGGEDLSPHTKIRDDPCERVPLSREEQEPCGENHWRS